jgi:nicotinamide-nucleotide amidase
MTMAREDIARLVTELADALRARGWHLASAESCTGGMIAAACTDLAGSSDWFERGVVSYSNEAKTALLGVPPGLLEQHGAVSEPVARAMAEGMQRSSGADLAVAVTGIAGPAGGTPAKPVGTVAVAVAAGGETRSRLFRFFGERELVKFQASQAGLDMVRRLLQGHATAPAPGTLASPPSTDRPASS